MANPTTRQGLIDYCLRRLGDPVIEINVDIDQLEDRVDEAIQMHENIFSTGELGDFEQSLVVKTSQGLVVVAGCSHPGVACILENASPLGKVTALMGGLHGFNAFGLIQNLDWICPAHCTRHQAEIKKLYPEKFLEGGVGRVITL